MAEFWRGMNKSQVEAKCREIINPFPMGIEFKSVFVSDLIGEKHKFWIDAGMKPEAFKKEYDNPYGKAAYYFHAKAGGIPWRATSWRGCIYPPDTRRQVFRAFRWIFKKYSYEHLKKNPVCSMCGGPAQECDHVYPEFIVLCENAYRLFTENHWEKIETVWKPMGQPFQPDIKHPAAYYIDYVHRNNLVKLQSVCKRCHVEQARRRKQQPDHDQQDAAD